MQSTWEISCRQPCSCQALHSPTHVFGSGLPWNTWGDVSLMPPALPGGQGTRKPCSMLVRFPKPAAALTPALCTTTPQLLSWS